MYIYIKLFNKKIDNLIEQLYYPEVYDIQARTPKDNKLLELEKENKEIKIKISEPRKESIGRFFNKSTTLYKVQYESLNSSV